MWPVRTDVDPFIPTCIAVVHLGEVTNSGLSVNSITAAEKFLAKFTVHWLRSSSGQAGDSSAWHKMTAAASLISKNVEHCGTLAFPWKVTSTHGSAPCAKVYASVMSHLYKLTALTVRDLAFLHRYKQDVIEFPATALLIKPTSAHTIHTSRSWLWLVSWSRSRGIRTWIRTSRYLSNSTFAPIHI